MWSTGTARARAVSSAAAVCLFVVGLFVCLFVCVGRAYLPRGSICVDVSEPPVSSSHASTRPSARKAFVPASARRVRCSHASKRGSAPVRGAVGQPTKGAQLAG